ncbi:MAG: hypothetical protein I8H96_13235 [Sphingomonadaceae bacterium]|nr:hypothetical protein [Sphingomonadaceae bacterium]
MLITGMIGSAVRRPAIAQGPSARPTIVAASRGVPKFRRHMPHTIAAADRQAIVAMIQSPLRRHIDVPTPSDADQRQERNADNSRGGVPPAAKILLPRMRTAMRSRPSPISNSSQLMNGAEGWRQTAMVATAVVLSTPPRKIGREEKRPFLS